MGRRSRQLAQPHPHSLLAKEPLPESQVDSGVTPERHAAVVRDPSKRQGRRAVCGPVRPLAPQIPEIRYPGFPDPVGLSVHLARQQHEEQTHSAKLLTG